MKFEPLRQALRVNIPEEMKRANRWVLWFNSDISDDKKIPAKAKRNSNGKHNGARSNDPNTWSTFDEAVKAIGEECEVFTRNDNGEYTVKAKGTASGIGFMLGDGWCGVDLDGGTAHGKKEVPEKIVKKFMELNTYTERSMSGHGYHVIGKYTGEPLKPTVLPRDCQEFDNTVAPGSYLEFYTTTGRFFAVTGDIISEPEVRDITGKLTEYHKMLITDYIKHVTGEREKRKITTRYTDRTLSGVDDEFAKKNVDIILREMDSDNYDDWIKTGMCLKSAGFPVDIWDDFSAESDKYPGRNAIEHKWKSFNETGALTFGYLVKEARRRNPGIQLILTGEYQEKHEASQRKQERYNEVKQDKESRQERGEITTSSSAGNTSAEAVLSADGKTINQATGDAGQQTKLTPEEQADRLFIKLSDVQEEEKRYIFSPYFPVGKITAISADPGVGKTKVMCGITALITTGQSLCGIPCREPGNVLLLSMEDDGSDFLNTVRACGGDTDKVTVVNEKLIHDVMGNEPLTFMSPVIEAGIKKCQPKMVIFDPYQKFIGKDVDMNTANKTNPVLSYLTALATKYEFSAVIIGHNSKAQTRMSYKFMGSVDYLGNARSALAVVRDPNKIEQQENLMIHVKSNNKVGKSIRYKIESIPGHEDYAQIRWLGTEIYTEKDYAYADRSQLSAKLDGDDYEDNPLVIMARQLIKDNNGQIFLTFEGIKKVLDIMTGGQPYATLKEVSDDIPKYNRLLQSRDGIIVEKIANASIMHGVYLNGEFVQVDDKGRGIKIKKTAKPQQNGQITIKY